MNSQYSPADIRKLIVTCTGCLCLVILVMGTILGVLKGSISAEILGSIKGIGIGGGLLGLGLIIYQIIKVALRGEAKEVK